MTDSAPIDGFRIRRRMRELERHGEIRAGAEAPSILVAVGRILGILSGTAFFYKQRGGRTPKSGGRELDGRTWDEMPAPVSQSVPASRDRAGSER